MNPTAAMVMLNNKTTHRLAIVVSVASLALITLTLYSLHLQIKHTKMKLCEIDNKNE